jgi:hypothetical protein
MKTKPIWAVSDTKDAKYLGILEFQDDKNEWYNFEILQLGDRLVFGGACNVGFLESGYILRDEMEHLNDTLHELEYDLKAFYNGEDTRRIVYNERM